MCLWELNNPYGAIPDKQTKTILVFSVFDANRIHMDRRNAGVQRTIMFLAVARLAVVNTLFLTGALIVVVAGEKLDAQDHHPNLRPRRNKECPDGFGGINCKDNVDECKGLSYPCAGGITHGSFCVDYNPPEKFKCGCRPGYDAVLPDAIDIKDPVPVEWRPLNCLPRNVCVDFLCHEDATCSISSTNTARCVCNDILTGDGITNCSFPNKTGITKPPSRQQWRTCIVDSDCNKLKNSACVDGLCNCKAGFYLSNGKGQCVNENECADGFPNDCHQNAVCTDTEGSYTCSCKDGYQDFNPNDAPGTICAQINECLSPTLNNCDNETKVCLDLPPPGKWQCVERTPAPTPVPVCDDTGFTFTLRETSTIDSTVYTDLLVTATCNSLLTLSRSIGDGLSSGYCNCPGKYPSRIGYTKEFIASRKGANVADVCCYCKSRPNEVCVL